MDEKADKWRQTDRRMDGWITNGPKDVPRGRQTAGQTKGLTNLSCKSLHSGLNQQDI